MTKSVTLEKRLNSPDGTHNIFHFIKERRNFRENSHITKKILILTRSDDNFWYP